MSGQSPTPSGPTPALVLAAVLVATGAGAAGAGAPAPQLLPAAVFEIVAIAITHKVAISPSPIV